MNAVVDHPFRPDSDDEVARLRQPPHSLEAEQSVLGGLLLECLALDRVADILGEADFYLHDHRVIFAAISALVHANKPADTITVFERLQGLGQADNAGGLAYLNALAQSVPSAANIRRYAEIVRDRSALRRLIAASDEIATAAFNPKGRPVREVISDAERKVLEVSQAEGARAGGSVHRMPAVMLAVLDRVQALSERLGDEVPGVPTGYPDLDRMTAGMQAGDLLILAARPSMGKTAFALNIAEHVAVRRGLGVIVFSMEMGAAQLGLRMAGAIGRIDQQRLRSGRLADDEWGRLAEASDRLTNAPLVIDEASGLTVGDMRSRARRLARDVGAELGLIVVDYIQLMSGSSGREENRATELGEISRNLKSMAKELRCPVIALSQLNRGVESRHDKRPLMSDLRESGAIEQDADVIAFIYRDEYSTKEDCEEPGVAEIIIAKQRSGPTGMVRLAWSGAFTRFDSMAPGYVPPRKAAPKKCGFAS